MKKSLVFKTLCGKCHNWYCGTCQINQEQTDALDRCNKNEFEFFKLIK